MFLLKNREESGKENVCVGGVGGRGGHGCVSMLYLHDHSYE